MGPLVEPRVTACYACCRTRREAAHFGWKAETGAEEVGVGLPFAVGLDLLALEVLKILSGAATPMTWNRLWRLDLASGVATLHPVLKLPRCPACGVAARPPRKLWIR
jgi:bacteriocin biosynthesis cyclodehydratase domain-containing protein